MSQECSLAQLTPNMNSVNATVIVLDPGQIRRTQTGTILTMKVSDSSGSINATIMNPDFVETWRSGDILKIRGGYTSVFQGGLTLGIGRNGECKKNGEFAMHFSEVPDITAMPLPAGVTAERRPGGQESGGPNRGSGPFQSGQRPRPSH